MQWTGQGMKRVATDGKQLHQNLNLNGEEWNSVKILMILLLSKKRPWNDAVELVEMCV